MNEIEYSEIIPPLLRRELIRAGEHRQISAIDEAHRNARQMYPKLFRADDDSSHLAPPTNAHQAE